MARGSSLGNNANFWDDFIRRGLSQNKSIDAFREAGGAGSNKVLREGFQQARDSMGRYANISALPGGEVPAGEHFQPWKAGRPDRFVGQTKAWIYDKNLDMTYIKEWTVPSDVALSPDEYAQLALDELEDWADEEERYKGQKVLFVRTSGLYRTI